MRLPNYTVGGGRLYIAYNDDPTYGERYLGSSQGFAFTPEVTSLGLFDSDGGVVRQTGSEIIQVTARCLIILDDISNENLGLFMVNAEPAPVQRSSEQFTRTIRAVRGNIYDLGAAAIRDLTAEHAGEPMDLSAFTLDGAAGLIQVREDAEVYTGQEISFSFIGDGTTSETTGPTFKAYKGPLRFVEDNLAGENRVLYIPEVVLYPDSDLDLKASSWRTLTLRAEVTSVPRWIDKKSTDDYHIGSQTEDFGDLSVNAPVFTDDYGVQ